MEWVQVKATEMTKGSEFFSHEKRLWKSFLTYQPEDKAWEDLINGYKFLTGSEEDRGRLSSIVLSSRTRRIGHKWNTKFLQKPLFYCVCSPETFWSHSSWRYLKPDWIQSFAIHSSWPCLSRGWTKGAQESHSHLNSSMKIQLDCVTWKLEWGQLYLSINWIKVNRFSSKQSSHSGFVNIYNSRRSPQSLQSSTSCSLHGACHNEDVALQTLLSIDGNVLQWLSSFLLRLKRAVGNYLLSQIGFFWISTSIPMCRLFNMY